MRKDKRNNIYATLEQNGFIVRTETKLTTYFRAVESKLPRPIGNDKATLNQQKVISNFLENRGSELSEEMYDFLKDAHHHLQFNQYSYLVGICLSLNNKPTDKQRALCREMLLCPLIKENMKAEMHSELTFSEVSELINRYYTLYKDWKDCTPTMREKAYNVLCDVTFDNVTDENKTFIACMTKSDYESFMDCYYGEFAMQRATAEEELNIERAKRIADYSLRNDRNEYDSFSFVEYGEESEYATINSIWTLL